MSGRCVYLTPQETWEPLLYPLFTDKASCDAYNKCASGGVCVEWQANAQPAPTPVVVPPSLQVGDPSTAVGGNGGNSQTPLICNPDEVMVGMKVRSGNSIDGLVSVMCNSTENIILGKQPREVMANWGSSSNGSVNSFVCPTNQALVGYKVGYGNTLNNIQLQCVDLKTSSATEQSPKFGSGDPSVMKLCDTGKVLAGIGGNSGNAWDSVKGVCRDISGLQKTFFQGQAAIDCCSGTNSDPLLCSVMHPSSDYCNTKVKPGYCTKREFFTTSGCKQMLGSEGKQVSNQIDQDLVDKICTDIKNDPNATQQEIDWCSCVNASTPQNIDPTLRGVFRCIDTKCMTVGLKPFGMSCPSAYTICNANDFKAALNQSEIGKLYVANNCGQLQGSGGTTTGSGGTTTGTTPPTSTGGTNTGGTTTTPPTSTGGTSPTDGSAPTTNYTRIALYILGGLLVLSGIIFLTAKFVRKQ